MRFEFFRNMAKLNSGVRTQMIALHNDIFPHIFEYLNVRDALCLAATGKRFETRVWLWIKTTGRGKCEGCYKWRKYRTVTQSPHDYEPTVIDDLRIASVCPCGAIGWDAHAKCSCWIECTFCKRKLPAVLCGGRCKLYLSVRYSVHYL